MVSVAFAKPVQPRVQWCHAGTGASVIRAENVPIRDVERNTHAPCVGGRSIKLCGSSAARHRAPQERQGCAAAPGPLRVGAGQCNAVVERCLSVVAHVPELRHPAGLRQTRWMAATHSSPDGTTQPAVIARA